MARYRVLTGLNYPPDKRAEIGDVVEDLPAQSVKWLIADGYIEDADKPKKTVATEPTPAPVKKEVEFKSDAKDGDKDGLVQDGTIHERPVEEK